MPPNSARCSTRSSSRSLLSSPTAPTQDRVYDAVTEHSAEAAVVVPPRATAVLSTSAETDPTQRDRHIQTIAEYSPTIFSTPPRDTDVLLEKGAADGSGDCGQDRRSSRQ
jgi:hypothetical protein